MKSSKYKLTFEDACVEINTVHEKQLSFHMRYILLAFVMAILIWADVARAETDTEKQEWLERVNTHLSEFSRFSGCEFPRTSEFKLSQTKIADSPMERKFAIPKVEDHENYLIYEALIGAGFIENNAEPIEIESDLRRTFSLTMKGWKAFPLNRGGQRTCIHWTVRERANAIVSMRSLDKGMRIITYEIETAELPDWLPAEKKARYRKTNSVILPESAEKRAEYLASSQFGELSKHSLKQIRSRFPNDETVLEMAQKVLDGFEPCIEVDAGSIENLRLTHLQKGHGNCLRFGKTVAKEIVATPDGQPNYVQYFIVHYVIEDVEPWIALPGMRENLPEPALLCIKYGWLMQVRVERNGQYGGSHPGCSLPLRKR